VLISVQESPTDSSLEYLHSLKHNLQEWFLIILDFEHLLIFWMGATSGLVSFVPVTAENMMAHKVALIINEGCEPQ
jgi:hypothetical protein